MIAKVALLVEGSQASPPSWNSLFQPHPVEVLRNPSLEGIKDSLSRVQTRIFVIDCSNALECAQGIRSFTSNLPLVALVATSSEDRAIAALRIGLNDYLKLSCATDDVARTVLRWADGESPASSLFARGKPMIGESKSTCEIRSRIGKAAATDSNVLVTGETGTGKELVADLIHQNGPRHQHPMVRVNCAAIPESLVESELFGHERGAFTGAAMASPGKLQSAGGGTLFFDEIGDMSLAAQAKILRAIENREYQRLGSSRNVAFNARIIAGTNRVLERFLEEDRFRKDLYFRLSVVRIHLTPLRERPEDVPPLIDHFVELLNASFGQSVRGVSDEVRERFMNYSWPGNVRELRNVMESIFLEAPGSVIHYGDVPQIIREHLEDPAAIPLPERARMMAALHLTHWNVTRAAEKMRWSRMTFYRKMARHQIASEKV